MPPADTSPPSGDTDATSTTAPESGRSRDPIDVNKVVQDRLARQAKQHAIAVEAARAEAIAGFRREHGIDDDSLAGLGASKVSDLHKALASTQEQLRVYQQREAQHLEERKQRALDDAVIAAVGDKLIPDAEGREFVIAKLKAQLVVDDNGKVTHPDGEVGKVLDQQLSARFSAFAKATTPNGGASSRPPRSVASDTRSSELLGEQVADLTPAEQARAIVQWARAGEGR